MRILAVIEQHTGGSQVFNAFIHQFVRALFPDECDHRSRDGHSDAQRLGGIWWDITADGVRMETVSAGRHQFWDDAQLDSARLRRDRDLSQSNVAPTGTVISTRI